MLGKKQSKLDDSDMEFAEEASERLVKVIHKWAKKVYGTGAICVDEKREADDELAVALSGYAAAVLEAFSKVIFG